MTRESQNLIKASFLCEAANSLIDTIVSIDDEQVSDITFHGGEELVSDVTFHGGEELVSDVTFHGKI